MGTATGAGIELRPRLLQSPGLCHARHIVSGGLGPPPGPVVVKRPASAGGSAHPKVVWLMGLVYSEYRRCDVDRNLVFGIVVLVLGILVLAVPAFLQAVVGILLIVVGLLAIAGKKNFL